MNRRIGRRPGVQPTRQQIVEAARVIFASEGFRAATVRAIADSAHVDPAMIRHYFGTKERLFVATLEFPGDAPTRLVSALAGEPAALGEQLTRAYLALWEEPATRNQMVIATRASLSSDQAMVRVRPTIVAMLGQANTTAVPSSVPETRFALAMAHLLGVATVRYLSKVPPLCDLPLEEIIARTAPAIQLDLAGS